MSSNRFPTDILDRALASRREEAERLRLATIDALRMALASLPISYTAVVVFGSVVRPGRFRPDSDVDLAFEGLADEGYFRAKRYLENALERPVDLLQLEEHRLREIINRKGVRWIPADLR